MRFWTSAARATLACAVCFGATRAGAQEQAPGPVAVPGRSLELPACRPRAEPGALEHDGFFLRSQPGVALFWANVAGAATNARTGIRGIGQSGTLEAGATPWPGVVLGGAVWSARIDPVFVEHGHVFAPDDDSVKVTQLRVGPFVDWYPNPFGGYHASLSLGAVVEFETDTKGNPLEPLSYGAALTSGSGYEWFVTSNVSLGFLAQVAFGAVRRNARGTEERILFLAPELALTATYH